MSCCGNKRAAFTQEQSASARNNPGAARLNPKMWPDQAFQHTGTEPITIRGSITGRLYTWIGKNDIQQIDFRDSGALKNHPLIRSYK